ncbi:UNVERIFIED_CONTAM: protein mobE, partial [Pseudomonas aeruginosa]
QGQYEKFPQAIAQAAKDTLVNFKVTADATVKASAEAAKADLAQAVAAAAQEVAHNTSAKQMWQWAAGCIAVAFLCVGLFGWYMHSSGKDSGYQAGYGAGYGAGYTEAKDEKAAAAWANTPEGRL